MINAIAALLLYQLAGEVVARATGVPVPGPVIGMALLFATLLARGGVPAPLQAAAEGLLRHLALLFVPAGTGVLLHAARIGAEWPAIAAALVVSTVLAIAAAALVMKAVQAAGAPRS